MCGQGRGMRSAEHHVFIGIDDLPLFLRVAAPKKKHQIVPLVAQLSDNVVCKRLSAEKQRPTGSFDEPDRPSTPACSPRQTRHRERASSWYESEQVQVFEPLFFAAFTITLRYAMSSIEDQYHSHCCATRLRQVKKPTIIEPPINLAGTSTSGACPT